MEHITRLTRNRGSSYLNIPRLLLKTHNLLGKKYVVINPLHEKTFSMKIFGTLEEVSKYVYSEHLNKDFILTKIIPSRTRNAFILKQSIREKLNINKAAYIKITDDNPNYFLVGEIAYGYDTDQ